MTAYLMVFPRNIQQDRINDLKPYLAGIIECLKDYDGEYIIKQSPPTEVLEGDFPYERVTCFKFPSMEKLQGFWYSEHYQKRIKPIREGIGTLDVWAIPGIDEAH